MRHSNRNRGAQGVFASRASRRSAAGGIVGFAKLSALEAKRTASRYLLALEKMQHSASRDDQRVWHECRGTARCSAGWPLTRRKLSAAGRDKVLRPHVFPLQSRTGEIWDTSPARRSADCSRRRPRSAAAARGTTPRLPIFTRAREMRRSDARRVRSMRFWYVCVHQARHSADCSRRRRKKLSAVSRGKALPDFMPACPAPDL